MRRAVAAGLLLFLAPVVRAAEVQDLVLSSLLVNGGDRQAPVLAPGGDPGDRLAEIAGVESFPAACATPLALLLARPEAPLPAALQAAVPLSLARPVLDSERTVAMLEGQIAVHYSPSAPPTGLLSVDRDRDGLPDLVDRIGEAVAASRSFLVGRLGYPPPVPDGERLDVYVADLGRGLEGYAAPRGSDGASPFLVLDSRLAADRVVPAALHQFAHLSLLAVGAPAPRFWHEASASYLALLLTGDLKAHEAALRLRLQSPARGLAPDGLLLMEGGLLWPMFLAERQGDPGVLRAIWEAMAAQGLDVFAATDAVLRRSGGSLQDAVREFHAWNLFTGERADGQHYALARSLPAATLAAAGPDLPLRIETQDPIDPLGSSAWRLPGDGGRGTIEIEIAGEGGRPAADLLIFYRAWGPQPVLVPVTLDGAGTARLSIPWSDAREAWIVLRNDALPGAPPARFDLRVTQDPYAPFDLAGFIAQEAGPSAVLEWTTASERGLVAWNVYRATTPGGPFTRLNSVAVPAMGDAAADTGYVFVDDYVQPGRRYYYLLEGLTSLGLPQRSHTVSVRIPR